MDVQDLMTRDVFALAEDTELADVVRLLKERKLSGAPVVCKDGRPVGMVSLRDLADPSCPAVGTASDAMSSRVVCVDSGASLREAAELMVAESLHRLLVVDDGRMVGILSALDVLPGLLRQIPE